LLTAGCCVHHMLVERFPRRTSFIGCPQTTNIILIIIASFSNQQPSSGMNFHLQLCIQITSSLKGSQGL
jgi:hypothetical protein